MLRAPDLAYLAAILEATPSPYPRKQKVIDAIQAAWKSARNVNTKTINIQVVTDYAIAEAKRKGEQDG